MATPDLRQRCIVSGCCRIADVEVRCRHATVYYCRAHGKRWSNPEFIPQPATASVLAGRFWDADRPNGAKRRVAP